MSADRSVTTDALATLGTIISDAEKRDAIHLAVDPVKAAERLKPGQDVGLLPDGTASGRAPIKLGIVDPFVKRPVEAGERFWLIVYPRQITSLRHVWDHPNFPSAEVAPVSKSASEIWMRAWAMKHVPEDYYGDAGHVREDQAYDFAIEAGRTHDIGPYEEARDHIDSEWWSHWEIITGQNGDRETYFRCGC